MSRTTVIYVALLGEGVDVWRPVRAERLGGRFYRIVPQPYDRETETWEFEPGETVECEYIEEGDGPILAATGRAASGADNTM